MVHFCATSIQQRMQQHFSTHRFPGSLPINFTPNDDDTDYGFLEQVVPIAGVLTKPQSNVAKTLMNSVGVSDGIQGLLCQRFVK